jgi:hypothetical protein
MGCDGTHGIWAVWAIGGLWQSVKQLTKQQVDEFRAKTRAYREVRKNRLRWKPPDKLFKTAEGDEEKDEDGSLLPNEERKLPAKDQICARGQPFLKHGRHGKPHIKIINVEAKTGAAGLLLVM